MRRPKYSREERNRWYAQVEVKKLAVKEVCEIFGISRQCRLKECTGPLMTSTTTIPGEFGKQLMNG